MASGTRRSRRDAVSSLAWVATLCAVATSLAGWEWALHQRRIRSIPVRVHINGTRGKSSVARLIGAGLRAGGLATITKVTGTFPRLILEDGREVEVHRRGRANILEQLGIVGFAASRRVDALVVECMALQPENQWITEHQMIHATVGVMTNVRLDHCDVMGETLQEIVGVLGRTVPTGSVLFSAERAMGGELAALARRRGSTAHFVSGEEEDDLRPGELNRLDYLEHGDNVALALAVCGHLGVDRDVALDGMAAAVPDAGALTCCRLRFTDGRRLDVWNAFAANDPESTLRIWQRLGDDGRLIGRRLILLNSRADRADRSRQLVALILESLHCQVERVVLMGEDTGHWATQLRQGGFPDEQLVDLGSAPASRVVKGLFQQVDDAACAVAIGNMGGQGAATVEYLEHLAATAMAAESPVEAGR